MVLEVAVCCLGHAKNKIDWLIDWHQTSLSPPSTAVMNASVWLTKTTPIRFSRSSRNWLIAASTDLGRTSRLTSKPERHLTASFINTLAYSGHGQAATALIITCSKHELTRNATRNDPGILWLLLPRDAAQSAVMPQHVVYDVQVCFSQSLEYF